MLYMEIDATLSDYMLARQTYREGTMQIHNHLPSLGYDGMAILEK